MMRKLANRSVLAALLVVVGAAGRAEAGLIVNGGFETGDFTGWTLNDPTGQALVDGSSAHTGNYGASFRNDTVGGNLRQSITTIAGHAYQVSFWAGGGGSALAAVFGGEVEIQLNPFPGGAYTQYSFTAVATGTTTDLLFAYFAKFSRLTLDDISVEDLGPVNAVPEPSTLISGGLAGVVGLGLAWRRRKAKASA